MSVAGPEDASTQVDRCRSCGSPKQAPLLSLGDTPIANSLRDSADAARQAPRYPLGIMMCRDCGLVQLADALPAEAIFTADYPYFSSYSDELRKHSRLHAEQITDELGLGPQSLVVEIGSNDGYLLREFRDLGVRVLGIDPSPGPAAVAQADGIDTLVEFFGVPLAQQLRDQRIQPDLILANNVMAHVPDLNSFVAGITELAGPSTTVQIENPSVRELVDKVEFDTIYHEHYCYFSSLAVLRLLARHGLTLQDVEQFPLHGGTLRWTAGRGGPTRAGAHEAVGLETAAGLDRPDYFVDFRTQVASLQSSLMDLLTTLRNEGSRVAAYGAAAKGATLLNSSGVQPGMLSFVADRNVNKQGRFMPGVALEIVSPEQLIADNPDYVLLLAWNFVDEILQQLAPYRAQGGRIIVPVPQLTIV
jgi:SAM-dependent methyltransferase